jgi:uncharacterized membrane protein
MRRWLSNIIIAAALLLAGLAHGAQAHEHDEQEPALAQPEAARAQAATPDVQAMVGRDGDKDDRPITISGRLFAWLGHMHPFAVHFPIALFPISWIALIFARRRGDRPDLIRAFVIVAGAAAVVAATLGWLDAGMALADTNPIRLAHRWMGTTLALIGALLAIWAWRRSAAVDSRPMVWALGLVTVALLVQGWLGAVLTHGMGHMMF